MIQANKQLHKSTILSANEYLHKLCLLIFAVHNSILNVMSPNCCNVCRKTIQTVSPIIQNVTQLYVARFCHPVICESIKSAELIIGLI